MWRRRLEATTESVSGSLIHLPCFPYEENDRIGPQLRFVASSADKESSLTEVEVVSGRGSYQPTIINLSLTARCVDIQ